jgi:hypothetical protein
MDFGAFIIELFEKISGFIMDILEKVGVIGE